jgi:hypothetical protein
MVLRRYGRSEQVVDVRDVPALREAVARARSDPDVIAYRYWRLPDDTLEIRAACRSCGYPYQPGGVQDRTCRCGLRHVTYDCRNCYTVEVDPGYGDGCGEVPFDAEGFNAKYRRRWFA